MLTVSVEGAAAYPPTTAFPLPLPTTASPATVWLTGPLALPSCRTPESFSVSPKVTDGRHRQGVVASGGHERAVLDERGAR